MLEGCVFTQRPLENIICSLSTAHPFSPSTLVNFLIHIRLREVVSQH